MEEKKNHAETLNNSVVQQFDRDHNNVTWNDKPEETVITGR